ncbi:DUF6090 family protein [Winogradskyella flava]|uniref:DUF6090 family protein n=1 Tax=Winogradskyella flava TaxID=1884876 RepID=UPI002492FA2B|nr:DUF6090 family protein [Winogradskyella flava]
MIKFFRHIRRSLIQENKMGKYFKYAIGEILLVVIGILIALQINNWNNNRIDGKREATYIKNIKRDLNNQLKAIELQMDFENEVGEYCNIALQHYNKTNTLKIDSTFANALGSITSRRTFLNPNPAYTELISSGNIELIKNEKFKDKLINYYQELERIEKVIDKNNMLYIDQQFSPTIYRLGVLNTENDWDNVFRGFGRSYRADNPLTPSNTEHLLSISQKLLAKEENELLMVNHLANRKSFALLHTFFLLEFKAQTNAMLEAIKSYNE